jgi:prolyl oligopeptidase
MKRSLIRRILLTLFLAALGASLAWSQSAAPAGPPPTAKNEVRETLHGVELSDPYRWLEDQWSPETRAWIEAQNQYTMSKLGALPSREPLTKRLTELLKIDAVGTPTVRGNRYFFSKRSADQDLFVLYVRSGRKGKDKVLVDPHGLSADHRTSVNLQSVSSVGRLLAYGIRQGGADEISVKLLEVDTGRERPDVLPSGRYFNVSVTPDKAGLYYTRLDKDGPRIYYHALGTDPSGDKRIFGEGYGPEKIIAASLSEDGRWLLVHVLYGSAADKTEVYVFETSRGAPSGPPTTIVNDVQARFFGQLAGDRLYLLTNWQAPNSRLLAVDLKNPARDHWREIIPEQKGVVLEGVMAAGGRLVAEFLQDVQSKLKVFDADGRFLREVALPAIGSVGGFSGRWSRSEAFYSFSSFHIPTTIYRYDVKSGKQEVWARLAAPVRSEDFELKQVWYNSKDGTRVPMFLLYRKGLPLNGSNPTLLTGYGGFTISLTPAFSTRAVAWAEQGGVYAVPNLRGGGEFGEEWHKAGMRERKQNVFDDFAAAAEWLIAQKYTNPKKLAIAGGSNGGLLVGAALTQRPELFQAVVCSYPLLDMVRFHRFLVARFWVPEYGSADDPEQFRYLRAYSPYQNVKPGTKYPAVLFITGDSDTRVDPLHARKMAALVQAATGSDRPVLLHYDTKSGHSGGTPVSKQIEDLTDELSFLGWQLGMEMKK